MRWVASNLLGCVFWLIGLALATGSTVLPSGLVEGINHRLLIGALLGLGGLMILLWANFLDTAGAAK